MTGQGCRCAGLAPPGGYMTSTIVACRRRPSSAGNLPENAVRDWDRRSCAASLPSIPAIDTATTVTTLIDVHCVTLQLLDHSLVISSAVSPSHADRRTLHSRSLARCAEATGR